MTFTAGASITSTITDAVDSRPGNTPDPPAPCHDTDHSAVADTRNPPGAETDRNTCPQSGDAASGGVAVEYGVPGPAHSTDAPSPSDHVTDTGVAVAVTAAPGTLTVFDTGTQPVWSIHNHVGNPTNCRPTGDKPTATRGSISWSRAAAASSCGVGEATPPLAAATGSCASHSRPPGTQVRSTNHQP
ncbi:hypothetical protein [Pseudonocardia sp. TRM90224]|uniref:hypothetical protein n=1 Tax=Pseudonocardia sp. TRM90224 TaxID=2812678 RepID=UPI001E38C2C2|nr:hypothetical protein [Pseudonocardia sp. TRM90224]